MTRAFPPKKIQGLSLQDFTNTPPPPATHPPPPPKKKIKETKKIGIFWFISKPFFTFFIPWEIRFKKNEKYGSFFSESITSFVHIVPKPICLIDYYFNLEGS